MADAVDMNALKSLKEIIGGDPDDLQGLVDDFISELPVQVQRMQDQSIEGDLNGLRITAHSCKSNSRDLGALTLSQLCAQLESASASGDTTNMPELLQQISGAADAALSNYETLDISDV